MKILLLANKPEKTTRLQRFKVSFKKLGHEVIIPKFECAGWKNWIKAPKKYEQLIKKNKPDIVLVFNVPDIIYWKIPSLKGKYYKKLWYDCRSPWGVELGLMLHNPLARFFGEICEKKLIKNADIVTAANTPLSKKIQFHTKNKVIVIPNYPPYSFIKSKIKPIPKPKGKKIVLFVGAICKKEGLHMIAKIIKCFNKQDENVFFWIIGTGRDENLLKKNVEKYKNVKFWGWQDNKKLPAFIKSADICVAPLKENETLKWCTDESILKINEYLNLGKEVIASGIIPKEKRKNLIVVPENKIVEAILKEIKKPVEKFNKADYRLWENHCEPGIKEICKKIEK